MPGENRLVNLDMGCPCADQAGNFLSEGVRGIEGEWLFLSVVLVKCERRQGQRSREDRFHRSFRIRLRELPFVHEDRDRKSTRLNSSHSQISYAVFCLK